ncbi:MAG: VCBS repeat-containing protein [Burkholderiales bacterium]|nr:VCBS repeat-containing protein [Burkholderiales bacterium]
MPQAADGRLHLFFGESTTASRLTGAGDVAALADVIVTGGASFANRSLVAAGDVDGDGRDDILLTGASGTNSSLLLYGGGHTGLVAGDKTVSVGLLDVFGQALSLPLGPLFALGDVDGDGRDDLGANVFERGSLLIEGATSSAHQVGHVYFGASRAEMAAWSGATAPRPDLVIEPAQPDYALTDLELVFGLAASGPRPRLFVGVGDVDGDGRADLVQADRLSGNQRILHGKALTATPIDALTAPLAAEPFIFGLATPQLPTTTSAPGLTLPTQAASPLSVGDAPAWTGSAKDDRLGMAQAVGDLNGDRFDDFLIRGDKFSYVLFGPVELADVARATDQAEIVIDHALMGVPAVRMGDVNGDGKGDLVFVKENGTTDEIRIVFGGPEWPRQLTLADVDRTLTLDNLSIDSVLAMNWNGDGKDDLVLASNTTVHVVSGAAITSATAPVAVATNSITTITRSAGSLSARAQVIGDYNGDGLDDLLLSDTASSDANAC